MLDEARANALDADIAAECVGEEGSTSVTFWTMVHAWRLTARRNECKKVDRQEQARVDSGFSVAEVEQFQEVFSLWAKQDPEHRDEEPIKVDHEFDPSTQPRRKSIPDLYSSGSMCKTTIEMLSNAKVDGHQHLPELKTILGGGSNNGEELCFQGLKNLLGHLHLKLSPTHVEELDREMVKLTGDEHGSIDFANFLVIMRWMMDTNFAHLNDLTAEAVATAAEEDDQTDDVSEDQARVYSKQHALPCSKTQDSRDSVLFGRRGSFGH